MTPASPWPDPDPRPRCPVDRVDLLASGLCPDAGGYPLSMACPFVCPICRQRLEWHGGCYACHGSLTPDDRETWTFPGDRYDCFDDTGSPIGDGQHWVRVDGPHRACSPAENAAHARALVSLLSRIGTSLPPIPLGACPQHPAGCGRSGRAWPSGLPPAPPVRAGNAPPRPAEQETHAAPTPPSRPSAALFPYPPQAFEPFGAPTRYPTIHPTTGGPDVL